MPRSAECLPDDKLIALAEGKLPAGELQAAEAHLAGCEDCSTTLEWIKLHLLHKLDSNGEPAPDLIDELELTDQREVPTRAFTGEVELDVDILEFSQTVTSLGKQSEYKIVRVLGRGGYGIVLEALDTFLQRPVAIKVLKRDLANRETSRRRFIREARAGAAINHPNVVTIHGVDEAEGIPFLIMELVRGDSLRERIRREPKLDMIDVISISAQIAQGLAAAHAHGIIHRDVKPGNIMLVDDLPRVKITDFGLARVAVEDIEFTSRGLAVGTPAYMSPEQVRGEEVDARSDLFALGCVIYAMLTGHSAFFGQTALEIARRIDSFDPPPLSEVDKRVPEFLSSIVQRLLQKDRSRRYQSAAEVADVLNRHLAILNQTPTDRLPAALRAQLLEPQTRASPLKWAIGLVALAVIAVLAISLIPRYGPDPVPAPGGGGRSAPTTSGPNNPTQTSEGTKPLKSEVFVAQAGDADATTIKDALELVAPGGQVTIRDAAEYHEQLQITDAKRFTGLRIVAPQHATVRFVGYGQVVFIEDVPGVELRGLKVVAPQMQIGVEINGSCPGLLLEDITIERVPKEEGISISASALALRVGAAGTADAPIVVRRAVLRDTNVGIVIANPNVDDPTISHIRVEECQVFGLNNPGSTLLTLKHRCENVVLQRNIFARGGMGLSMVSEGESFPRDCELSNNTWHDVQNWIVWTGPLPSPITLNIHDNLIVDAGPISDQALALSNNKAVPVYRNNRIFNSSGTGASFPPAATAIANLRFLSLKSSQSDYLKPDFNQPGVAGTSSEPFPEPFPGRYSDGPDPKD